MVWMIGFEYEYEYETGRGYGALRLWARGEKLD
jgi:hypothetical protein